MITVNHECYVSIEVAKLLKQAGFNWGVYSYYCMDEDAENYKKICFYSQGSKLGHNDCNTFYGDNTISAPTLSVAQRWLREVKESFIGINSISIEYEIKWQYVINDYEGFVCAGEVVDTYEEALEAGIKKALELISEKGK